MYDNRRRLLANRKTCTVIGLNDVLGQTSLRQQIQHANPSAPCRVNERTEFRRVQPGLNLIQIERGVGGGGGVVAGSSLHFMLGKNYKLLL